MNANGTGVFAQGKKVSAAFKAFHALRYRDFRLLWVGLAVSAVGTWMQIVALSLLVLKITHGSALALGTVSLAQALSFFLCAHVGRFHPVLDDCCHFFSEWNGAEFRPTRTWRTGPCAGSERRSDERYQLAINHLQWRSHYRSGVGGIWGGPAGFCR